MDLPTSPPTVEFEPNIPEGDYVEFLPITTDEDKIARVFAELLLTLLERDGHPSLKLFGYP